MSSDEYNAREEFDALMRQSERSVRFARREAWVAAGLAVVAVILATLAVVTS